MMNRKQSGGSGATGYGDYLWSKNPQAVSQQDNTIQPMADPTKYTGGKGVVEVIGVPAVLIAANHLYQPKLMSGLRTTMRKYKKIRGGGVADSAAVFKGGDMTSQLQQLSQMQSSTQGLLNSINPTVPASIVTNDAPKMTTQTGGNGRGGGIITNIAVPAVLLTANHLYKRKHTNKRNKPKRKTYKKRSFKNKR